MVVEVGRCGGGVDKKVGQFGNYLMLLFAQFYVLQFLSQMVAGLHRLPILYEIDKLAASELEMDSGVTLVQIVTVLPHPLLQRIKPIIQDVRADVQGLFQQLRLQFKHDLYILIPTYSFKALASNFALLSCLLLCKYCKMCELN